jgi:outer membrane receptor protein involved in Fe transport
MPPIRFYSIFTLLASAPLALSAAQGSETIVRAPRAESSATQAAATHVIVTAEELQATGERSLPRALARAAGVFVQETNLGGGAPILRGLVGNQILIVVDGVRLNDSTTRQGPNQSLNGIDPATVERIEVLRGPRSVLYGSDAIGGAILIWTKTRRPAKGDESARKLRAVLDQEYLSVANGTRGSLELSGAWDTGGAVGIGGYQSWSDLESGGGEVDHTGYSGYSWFGAWTQILASDKLLRFSAARTRDFDIPRTDRLNTGFGQTQPASAEFHFKLQDRERYLLSLDDQDAGWLADQVQWRLSVRRYDEVRHIRNTGSSTRRMEQDQTETLGLGFDAKKALGESHLLTWGLDVDYDDVDSTRDDVNVNTGVVTPNQGAFAPESNFWSGGLFLQDEIFSLSPWDVTAGVRFNHASFSFEEFGTGDQIDGEFDALTASLAAARDLDDTWRLTGTLAQGFRAPNLADLAKNSAFSAGTELANADLEPEQSLLAELALEAERGPWSGAIAVYWNTISDLIGRILIDPGGPQSGDEIYQRENVGTVDYFGTELMAKRRLGGEVSRWSGFASAEFIYGVQWDDLVDPNTGEKIFNGEPAQRVPPLHGQVGVSWEPPEPQRAVSWATLTFNWAFDQDRLSPADLSDPRIDPNGTQGWRTLDLDFGGPLGKRSSGSSWRAGIHNLWDEEYRVHGSGFDAPGLGFVVGLNVAR